jgi:hypothetical protein
MELEPTNRLVEALLEVQDREGFWHWKDVQVLLPHALRLASGGDEAAERLMATRGVLAVLMESRFRASQESWASRVNRAVDWVNAQMTASRSGSPMNLNTLPPF